MTSLPIEDYHVGIICALNSEMAAVEAMLDEEHENDIVQDVHDHNAYTVGRIHAHNVVIACLPAGIDGLAAAATVAKDMSRTFNQLRFGLLVGIGGGIPDLEAGVDIRLGDIVVSQPTGTYGGVVQYDKGKTKAEGQWESKGTLNLPPKVLLTALQKLQARHLRHPSIVSRLIEDMLQRYPKMINTGYSFPGQNEDCLRCSDQSRTTTAATDSAVIDPEVVLRPQRDTNDPEIHYGIIASGNQVIKDAATRDRLRRDCGALCVEMEAAGLMNDFPCLVIRGICDYADAHKNDRWHRYAAATAAAFAKELLSCVSVEQTNHEKPMQEVLRILNEHLQRSHACQEVHIQRQEAHYQDDKQRDCHRAFKTSNYEEHKNINPERAPGTCQWLLCHPKYRQWRENRHCDLLWLSADPGCGKSVLSRSLVDQDLRGYNSGQDAMTCYFFFKDNDIQGRLAVALCAVLHQLFGYQPRLIRHATSTWKKDGAKIASEVDGLWRILQAAMADQEARPMMCVLDALDECRDVDRPRLISMLCQFYNDATRTSFIGGKLKFLVTSRPYEDIEHHFGRIAASLPSIRLRGEDENDQIRREIDLVVQSRVQDLSQEFRLADTTVKRLEQKLLAMEHRTYLWLHLATDNIRNTFSRSLRPDEESVDPLPSSVDEAYEQILSKIAQEQTGTVRTILQIIVGARRPLSIVEMTLALGVATSKTVPLSLSDLSVNEDHLASRIRHWCGLFVFINHSRLYLIHQTAKEFLLRHSEQAWVNHGKWRHCLSSTDIEREMARVYILYLCLEDFEAEELKVEDDKQDFFQLAAESWADHWRGVESTAEMQVKDKAWLLYDMKSRRFSRWTKAMWYTENLYEETPSMGDLVLAAYNGHVGIMRRLLETSPQIIEVRDQQNCTALIRGAEENHHEIVALLLDTGADVNAQGGKYSSALLAASCYGHDKMVSMLLAAGAHVNAQEGGRYRSALGAASYYGHDKVVSILLAAGADVNLQGQAGEYGNVLEAASFSGQHKVVSILLDAGTDVDAQGGYYGNALQAASFSGQHKVVSILLAAGANVNAQGGEFSNALYAASRNSHDEIVSILVTTGANVNARGGYYSNALQAASANSGEKVVSILLAAGAEVNAQGGHFGTALQAASAHGCEKAVSILLAAGANVNREGGEYGTAPQAASIRGPDSAV